MRPLILTLARIALLLALAATGPARAGSDLLPFKATETTLPNGLKVIVVPTGLPHIVSLQIPVQTGSRNEVEPGRSGFAHFFEHMMFRGTPSNPPERYQAVLTRAGASQNAYTTDDYTNYHTTFAKDDLETILQLEADRFQHLAYSEDAFKTESRAVLGEYNKNSANPISKLFEVTRDAAYQRHTYKHTTMGFLKDIEDMPNQYAYSRQFFDRWYRPEHTTLIVAGDVQPAQVIALVRKYWGGWQRGRFQVSVPAEPAPHGPVVAHVNWPTPTQPWVSLSFHGPAFSVRTKDQAALATALNLAFGPSSALYKRLVQDEQTVDRLLVNAPERADPALISIAARVKKLADLPAVRDALLQAVAGLRAEAVSNDYLANAKSSGRYGLARSLDNTEQIAATLAGYVRFERSYATLNQRYRLIDSLTPDDLQSAARTWLTDAGLVQSTLASEALPAGMAAVPTLASLAPSASASASASAPLALTVQKSALPTIRFKLLFAAGSAHDPQGQEGLAALSAAMVAEAGSRERRTDEITQALFPIAGSFSAQVDKEMTVFTGSIHKDHWARFTDIVLPMLLAPGLREDDFRRLKDGQASALAVDLKGNNDEELGKERLQADVFAGTPYGHPVLGTARGLAAITRDDVQAFQRRAYTQGALRVGISGDVSEAMLATLRSAAARLPAGPGLPPIAAPAGHAARGLEVEIIEKNTRATAISFGLPIAVTRASADFAALSVVRSFLGEHRNSAPRLYQRIRELRGMNYGDYAYIEAFPRGMFKSFPDANLARRSQLFEVWIRPVTTVENAHLALRIALAELDTLVKQGMTQAQFEGSRDFLMKYVYLMTATQDLQLGYALDDAWYGTPEFTSMMRSALGKLTLQDVNAAIRRHLSATNLSVVFVTRDAAELKARLVEDRFSGIRYDGDKPRELLDEDQRLGAMKLGIRPEAVTITPVEAVFAQ